MQVKRYGKVKERTRNDKNEYIIYDDYAEIILYDNNSIEKTRTKIDLEDVDRCKNYKWYLNKDGYVCNKANSLRLNRFLLDLEDDNLVTDHISRDRLDNRKNNLRICTYKENSRNVSIAKNNKTGVTGVSYIEKINKWDASIMVSRKFIHLGRYSNKEDAVKARQEAELKYFGEFSPLYYQEKLGGQTIINECNQQS